MHEIISRGEQDIALVRFAHSYQFLVNIRNKFHISTHPCIILYSTKKHTSLVSVQKPPLLKNVYISVSLLHVHFFGNALDHCTSCNILVIGHRDKTLKYTYFCSRNRNFWWRQRFARVTRNPARYCGQLACHFDGLDWRTFSQTQMVTQVC